MPIKVPPDFPSPADVSGLRVVITGASRGLGQVLTSAFLRAGAQVAAVARSREGLDRLAEANGGEVLLCEADVSIPADNERVVDTVMREWGGIDVWIANAGISPVLGGPEEIDPEVWRRVIDVNLNGVFFGARAAARVLERGGKIIVTSSVLGQRPRAGLSAYSASKAGTDALVKGLSLDLAPRGITVNAVAPGWFDSPLAADWMENPRLEEQVLGHTALRRWGSSGDLPGAYLFLASPAAAYVTGTVLVVDGGYLAV